MVPFLSTKKEVAVPASAIWVSVLSDVVEFIVTLPLIFVVLTFVLKVMALALPLVNTIVSWAPAAQSGRVIVPDPLFAASNR